MSSSGSSSAVGARLRAMVDGLGERSAVLAPLEGAPQYLGESVELGEFPQTEREVLWYM
jgi:hypothetical protein